jgi:hypothetical protein
MVVQTTFNREAAGSSPAGSTISEFYIMTLSEKLMAILYCIWMAIPPLTMVVVIDLFSD